jgi:hypothetical protein
MSSDKIKEFNRESLKRIAREIVIRRYILILHVWVYIFVNILLFVINYFVPSDYLWFLWPLTAWAILLFQHVVTYTIFRKGIIHGGTIGITYHLTAFILVNSFLFFVSLFTSDPPWTFTSWFLWPLGIWGLGLLGHATIYFYIVPKKNEIPHKGWIERKIEKELKKLSESPNNLKRGK